MFNPTVDFVKEYLGATPAKILEVGDGSLSAPLTEAGYLVTEIRVADLLEYEPTLTFDAVLFHRTLHQVGSLPKTLDKVKKVLGERGRIIVDDFALENMDESTAEWFYELRDVVGLLTGNEPAPGETPLDRWKAEQHRETPPHTRKEMLSALESKFGNVHATEAPYLFHYFAGNAATERVALWEKRLIKKGVVRPLGLRVVAKKYFSYLK